MEYTEIPNDSFNNPETTPESVDNAIGRGRKKRLAKRAGRKTKKGKSKRAAKLTKKIGKVTKRQTRRKETTKKIKRGVKKVGKAVKKAGSMAIFLPLTPLKIVMLKGLQNKGISMNKRTPIPEIAKKFYNEIVVKHSSDFEPIDFDTDLDHIEPVTMTALVSGIITWIKGLKKKKEKGEALNKTEEKIVSGTEQVEKQIEEKAKEEAAQEVGSKILFNKKTQIIIAGVLLAIIGLVFALKKK